MNYDLAVDPAPSTVPGGTGILLLHPSTGETDRIDTDFLKGDTDAFFVISTRTTAREVQQKLEHFDVDLDKAVILDTLSVERGYSRRRTENIHYVSAPDDLEGIVAQTERFFAKTAGRRRISVDSITEMAYYADESSAREATERLLDLIREEEAVGLFHLSPEVHDADVLESYESLFDGVIELQTDGAVSARF
ncbi:MAG: ATPase domain-containing protein [Halobacteriales archaeon]